MAIHDRYARITPHELAFRSADAARAFADEVAEEAAGRGVDPGDPLAFATLGAVERFVRGLAPEDASAESRLRFGALAFQGYHFTRTGWPLYLLTVEAARRLVAEAVGAVPESIDKAGYLQLPQHLFWLDSGSGAPESVDGVHWVLGTGDVLHAVLVSGVRAGSQGVGVVPLPEAPFEHAGDWLAADVRGDGSDYSTSMPGAEIDGLYGLQTAGEVLKLLARFFVYAAARPDGLTRETGPDHDSSRESDSPGELPASRLAYTRVTVPR